MTTAVLVLAAGASSRMGQPKMLLPWQGTTLLQHIVAAAVPICQPVFVVAGEQVNAITSLLSSATTHIIPHPQWEQGMGSSIATGLTGILAAGHTPEALLLLVCDQPFVDTPLLQSMIDAKARSGKGIIACQYAGTVGIPVLFDQQFFPALQALSGQAGAKRLLQQFPNDLHTIPFPMGNLDIDTPEEYERIRNLKI